MTTDEIIRLARDAGFDLDMWQLSLGCEAKGSHKELERFAALVAAAEREACARECEIQALDGVFAPDDISDAIRARGNT